MCMFSWEYPDDLYHEVFDHVDGEVRAGGPAHAPARRAGDLPGTVLRVPVINSFINLSAN